MALLATILGNSLFAVSWQEKDGATVTNVQDYDRGLIHSHATLPGGQFLRMTGTFAVVRPADRVSDDRPQRNKALVLEAMTSLFQRHDASAVDRLYAPDYIQHNPDIPKAAASQSWWDDGSKRLELLGGIGAQVCFRALERSGPTASSSRSRQSETPESTVPGTV